MAYIEENALRALKHVWGHPSFRPGQWDVIRRVLERQDVLGVLPTGTGKSICYQLPGLLMDGTVVVVSPLIALMSDQVTNLGVRGIAAVALNSNIPQSQQADIWADARRSRYKFIYVSPELLQTTRFKELISCIPISFVAIDEAHCIAEWGRHFRPAFRQIADVIPESAGRMAVTATANPSVQRDIVKMLKLRSPHVVVTGYDRPNLFWSVNKVSAATPVVDRLLEFCDETAVVYCMTRRSVEWWAEWFTMRSIPTSYYHGGLDRTERNRSQTDWLCGRTRIMVATNAFGMGIDKQNVRLVLHIGLPSNLSAYYQEAGRAGRDGAPSLAALIYQSADVLVRRRLLSTVAAPTFRSGYGLLEQGIRQFAELLRYLETPLCRRRYILNYFGEAYGRNCGRCDHCSVSPAGHIGIDSRPSSMNPDGINETMSSDASRLSRLVKDGFVEYAEDLSSTRFTRLGKKVFSRD